MMHKLKNSVLSKALRVLLAGYFLISSLNLSNTVKTVTSATDNVQKKECMAWGVFKKLLKCNSASEEFEDGNDGPGCGSTGKVKLAVDYLIPGHTGCMLGFTPEVLDKKIFLANTISRSILYNKIHLRPPELTI